MLSGRSKDLSILDSGTLHGSIRHRDTRLYAATTITSSSAYTALFHRSFNLASFELHDLVRSCSPYEG